jgi:hypothetical protein
MNIADVFESLPLSEKTLLKHLNDYPYRLTNEDHPCEYVVHDGSYIVGMVKYYKGRKLSCYELRTKGATP